MENVKVGDIILVDNFKKEGITISRHSFTERELSLKLFKK